MSDFKGHTETTDAKPRPDYPIARLDQQHLEASPVLPRTGKRCVEAAGKHVRQYTLSGKFVAEYKTVVIAGKKAGVADTSIAKAARGEQATSGGFLWKYIGEKENEQS